MWTNTLFIYFPNTILLLLGDILFNSGNSLQKKDEFRHRKFKCSFFLKGNLKCYLRLTMATRPALPVLGIKKAVLEKAGLPDFSRVLREAGHQAMDSKNTRWIRKSYSWESCVWLCAISLVINTWIQRFFSNIGTECEQIKNQSIHATLPNW